MTNGIELLPSYLTIDSDQLHDNFDLLNEIEAKNIKEGITDSKSKWSVSDGRIKAPRRRNRYSNIFPFNYNRVRLPCKSKSDYINASRVQIDDENKYIVTQGPTESTIHHFWSMCFNESEANNQDTIVIVMLTSLVEDGVFKCIQYWPNDLDESTQEMKFYSQLKEDSIDINNLKVRFVNKIYNEDGDYLLTELELKTTTKTKKVYHYYYYKWADARVPPSAKSLHNLSEDIHKYDLETNKPIIPIIHCSAGVGRSGTFIVLDYIFRNPDVFFSETNLTSHYDPKRDPIYQTVFTLRTYRMMMVQTFHQYRFLYNTAIGMFRQIQDS
ncbi:protein-tyrosine phosphatase-like protein [Scheffersomyces amazonensis]|uniref:protein-tyrosine phosphatase-like protein n=1 Tax=Scheffersomyces amazonensis TaxID=1078765 RepID=UPI00315C7393